MTEPSNEFPLPGHPGVPAGLIAYAQPRPDGTFAHDAKGRPRPRQVHLRRGHDDTPPERPEGLLSDAQWNWATSGHRRWTTITQKLGDRAHQVALELARAGCVTLEHDYIDGTIRQPPRCWTPDPRLTQQHTTQRDTRRQSRSQLVQQALDLAAELGDDWPGVAAALREPAHETRLIWLVWAAGDLAEGTTHDSTRAFVQTHAGHTKARDDLPRLLAAAGFEPAALTQLGISRSPYIGLGGPIRAHLGTNVIDFTGFPGPHDLRLPPGQDITISMADQAADSLLVIENRQAAEAMCDRYPHLPVIWCHGQPGRRVLDLINQATTPTTHVIICPDADLGGIRIAACIHDHLPSRAGRTVIDIGVVEHVRGAPFSAHAKAQIARLAERADAIGVLAGACLVRGYVIEQEAPARAALQSLFA